MFTGIVRSIGRIVEVSGDAPRRLSIETGDLPTGEWRVGDSVAVAGVCLTVVAIAAGRFDAELSGETLSRTTLGRLARDAKVNLEPALRAADALGGHFVTGHVDGIARVRAVEDRGGSLHAEVEAPTELVRYLTRKGSIALDGVSLTVGEVEGTVFRIDVVPHTRSASTLGTLRPDQCLNIEIDLIARYVDRLLTTSYETRSGGVTPSAA